MLRLKARFLFIGQCNTQTMPVLSPVENMALQKKGTNHSIFYSEIR